MSMTSLGYFPDKQTGLVIWSSWERRINFCNVITSLRHATSLIRFPDTFKSRNRGSDVITSIAQLWLVEERWRHHLPMLVSWLPWRLITSRSCSALMTSALRNWFSDKSKWTMLTHLMTSPMSWKPPARNWTRERERRSKSRIWRRISYLEILCSSEDRVIMTSSVDVWSGWLTFTHDDVTHAMIQLLLMMTSHTLASHQRVEKNKKKSSKKNFKKNEKFDDDDVICTCEDDDVICTRDDDDVINNVATMTSRWRRKIRWVSRRCSWWWRNNVVISKSMMFGWWRHHWLVMFTMVMTMMMT